MNWQIGLGVIAGIVIAIAVWTLIRQQSRKGYQLTSREMGKTGYSIWRYSNRAWQMTEDYSAAGYVPGPAPTGKARYEGQCMRVISVKRPSGS
jgi:hypothetical protein